MYIERYQLMYISLYKTCFKGVKTVKTHGGTNNVPGNVDGEMQASQLDVGRTYCSHFDRFAPPPIRTQTTNPRIWNPESKRC